MYTINFWPILTASVVSFGIGALWYSPILFGKEWMSLTSTSDKDIATASARGIWKLYIAQFVVTVVAFAVLGFAIVAVGGLTASDGAFIGFLAWLGFVATQALGGLLWEKKPFKLVLINSVSTLITFVIGGSIIGAWG